MFVRIWVYGQKQNAHAGEIKKTTWKCVRAVDTNMCYIRCLCLDLWVADFYDQYVANVNLNRSSSFWFDKIHFCQSATNVQYFLHHFWFGQYFLHLFKLGQYFLHLLDKVNFRIGFLYFNDWVTRCAVIAVISNR